MPIPGRGSGMVATRHLRAGKTIFEEIPLLQVEGEGTELRKQFANTFAVLGDSKKEIIRSLYNAFPEDNSIGIFITNSYSLGPQRGLAGLFEKLSRMNHSCRPNSERCWDANREVETLYALQDIEAGEEITVTYFDVAEMTYSKRQSLIGSSWRFDCKCECLLFNRPRT
jgi:hypothetical protein